MAITAQQMDSDQNITSEDLLIVPGSESIFNKFALYIYRILKIFFPSYIFVKFFIAGLIPAIADQLIPLFYTGQIPNESALALAGQFTFISICLEVISESVCNSLFYYIGQNYKRNRILALQGLKLALIILFILGSILTISILCLTTQFVKLINTPSQIIESTKIFLWSSSFSFPIFLINTALINYFYITTSSFLILSQLIQVATSFLTNFFLFGQQEMSLHWGVEELGYYKIIQASLNLLINGIFLLVIERLSPLGFLWDVPLWKDLRQNLSSLFRVSWGNFGDSAIRNLFYFMVTLKFINSLGETEVGAWNLLNTVVWGLLLIPSNTIANYVKVRIGHAAAAGSESDDAIEQDSEAKPQRGLKSRIKEVAFESFICMTAWLVLISLVSCLTWPSLAGIFSQSNEKVQNVSGTMFYELGWIFIIFSFNNGMDSLFFGTGETSYIFYQSLITNLIVYLIPWILYEVGILVPTYWWVYSLYISGMIIDFALTTFFSVRLWNALAD